jgi:hypothetical protein
MPVSARPGNGRTKKELLVKELFSINQQFFIE